MKLVANELQSHSNEREPGNSERYVLTRRGSHQFLFSIYLSISSISFDPACVDLPPCSTLSYLFSNDSVMISSGASMECKTRMMYV